VRLVANLKKQDSQKMARQQMMEKDERKKKDGNNDVQNRDQIMKLLATAMMTCA
jgi:hypothetical protein